MDGQGLMVISNLTVLAECGLIREDIMIDPVEGRVILEGTLGKSCLPKERVGRPGKWPTLYTRLAWQARRKWEK